MDPGTVRGTMVKIFLQILAYDLRLCFRLVTKLSVWTDKTGRLLMIVESCLSHVERDVPQEYRKHKSV